MNEREAHFLLHLDDKSKYCRMFRLNITISNFLGQVAENI